ncbi:MAG TPA: hypothetical protein VHA82_01865 [Ramlibacter sp.]|uniref:hypothetical protein n=1 Tax=Ramlibacter sp. TaxID=1917967 RepID=UPI002C1FEAAA|nr:hypothetical protein [Ramlibacter sp.]HVZ42526.1 hypothetical protein [Ramlibacter sp.]
MCSQSATSREHVPPKCLFPVAKDVDGLNLRRDLTTVPSCFEHNSAKSADDEFLMMSLAGIVGNNSIAYRHWTGKVDRALKRSSYRVLHKAILKPERIHRLVFSDNRFMDVIWGKPDHARLHKCFRQILRALYFKDFGERFEGEIKLVLGFLKHEPGNAGTWQDLVRARYMVDADSLPRQGSNPQVFYHQRFPPDEFGLIAYRLCFYGALDVFASLIPVSSAPPPNLTSMLIDGGIKTIITVGEKAFEFN